MTRWEYFDIVLDDMSHVTPFCNQAGGDGWELCGMATVVQQQLLMANGQPPIRKPQLFFKRPATVMVDGDWWKVEGGRLPEYEPNTNQ